jgi:hypothetical protein
MRRSHARLLAIIGITLLVVLALGRAIVAMYTDVLWFGSMNQLPIYMTRLWQLIAVRSVAAAFGAAVVLLNLWMVARHLGICGAGTGISRLQSRYRAPTSLVELRSPRCSPAGGSPICDSTPRLRSVCMPG